MESQSFDSPMEMVKWFFTPSDIPADDVNLRMEFCLFATVLCDRIWQARNEAFHNGIRVEPRFLLKSINTMVGEFDGLKEGLIEDVHITRKECILQSRWINPRQGRIRVFTDAAYKDDNATTAIIVRDDNNNILLAYTECFAASTALEVEFRAVEYGLKALPRGGMELWGCLCNILNF